MAYYYFRFILHCLEHVFGLYKILSHLFIYKAKKSWSSLLWSGAPQRRFRSASTVCGVNYLLKCSPRGYGMDCRCRLVR